MTEKKERKKQLKAIFDDAERVPSLLEKIKELENENQSLKPYKDVKNLIKRFCFLKGSKVEAPAKFVLKANYYSGQITIICGKAIHGLTELSLSEFRGLCKEYQMLLNDAEELKKLMPMVKEFRGILPEEELKEVK